ncbi:MAG: hypothetical protein ACOY3I_00470 [Verrucomicrobiota bacterium]
MNLKKILAPATEAIRHYGLPFLAIQLCAVALVISYYHSEALRQFCERIAQWKIEGGILFAMWTNVVVGAFFPEIVKMLFGKIKWPLTIAFGKDVLFHILLFTFTGFMVDMLYRTQGILFGYELNFWTLAKKVFVDMLIWNPFFAGPFCALFFAWRKNHFSIKTTLRQYTLPFYKEKVLPILFPTWLYWLPMVSCIYAMPSALQFPLFLCAMAAWSLVYIFIAQAGVKDVIP